MFKFNYSVGDIKNSDLGEGIVCLGEGSGGKGGGKWGKGGREVGEKGEGSGGKGEGSGECLPPCPPPQSVPTTFEETLRKQAYSNVQKILTPKNETFQIKNFDIFHIFAQNIDCGYSLEPPWWGGSNKYHKVWFWAERRKIMYTPVNPNFTT